MVYHFSQFCGLGDYLAGLICTHVAHSADKLAGLQGSRRFYSLVWQLMLLVGVFDSFPHDSSSNNKLNTFSCKKVSHSNISREQNLKLQYLLRPIFKIWIKPVLPQYTGQSSYKATRFKRMDRFNLWMGKEIHLA